MRRILLFLLVLVLILGVVSAAAFTGYRFGLAQGMRFTANGQAPQIRPFDDVPRHRMPMHNFGFGREFHRGFGMGRGPMMGFGFFGPLRFLFQIVILGLIGWFFYWLFARSGWRLTRTTSTPVAKPDATQTQVTEVTEVREEKHED